jgi:DNA-binding LacI/PurR family transcriptional regulator
MPGVIRLADELGVARNTVEAALRELERDGLLAPQGKGRGRLIQLAGKRNGAPGLRVAILGDAADCRLDYLMALQHRLSDAGHQVSCCPVSVEGVGMDVNRIARIVAKSEADAWIVVGGSREVLEWFGSRRINTFALFGRRGGIPIAAVGPDKRSALASATRTLAGLGHRRIVLLTRERRRRPGPGMLERAYLDELAACGIQPGNYHLPDWEETPGGLLARLDALFRVTPPTALILDEVPFFFAAEQFLLSRGLRVPQDVSLVSNDASPDFAWMLPKVAHISWDSKPLVRRIVRWVDNVSHDRQDIRQNLVAAEFVPGGTIGPAKQG